MQKKIILSHPTGNSFVRSAAVELLNAGLLDSFYTTVATFPNNIYDKIGNLKGLGDFKRRAYDVCLRPYTHTLPWFELGRMCSTKLNLSKLIEQESGYFSVDSVYRTLDNYVKSNLNEALGKGVNAVYAYEDGALSTFERASDLGLLCLYDLPIGYWRSARKLLQIELEKWPEYAATITSFKDSSEKLIKKDSELRLAHQIFVASSFTAKTLADFEGPLAPIHVIPYGFPPAVASRNYTSVKNRPLKLLFVGGLSQRKGIANLFAAVENLGSAVSLTIVGNKMNNDCVALDLSLKKHRWINSLPHNEILAMMRDHDVLVFPSLFEGFGMVITEAMSQGTPVITTDRTAGPDLISHGINGWIIEAGSTLALQNQIAEILKNPDIIEKVGLQAIEAAKSRPWSVYGQELADAVKICLS
ncbi:glycosyltransferase family 4 protein [Pedobacter sp. PWIIR3]